MDCIGSLFELGGSLVGQLDFSRAQTTDSVAVASPAWTYFWVCSCILIFLLLCLGSATLLIRLGRGGAYQWPKLNAMPPAARALVCVGLLMLLLVQAMGSVAIYVQTREVHASTLEYFQYMSLAKLAGTSHAHLFGYTLLYGLIALCVTFSEGSERLKALLVATLLWSGVFDVASWWGIKFYSARFEWLAYASGLAAAASSLAGAFLVFRSLKVGINAPPAEGDL